MGPPITRHYVTVDGRRTHYRRCGQGPAVVMLHDSPTSSRIFIPLMRRLAGVGFCAIAPDTPGYGQSEPLDMPADALTVDHVADRLARVVDALGLGRFALYGFHSGAAIAAVFAAAHPDRVSLCLLNGYPLFTASETADILDGYLPPIRPTWDGSHLVWLWARMREQTLFFPWHRQDAAHRMDYDMPPPEATQAAMLDVLRAGDHYATVYAAVFRADTSGVLRRLRCPTVVCCWEQDPLFPHLSRIPDGLQPEPTVLPFAGTRAAVEDGLVAILREADKGDAAPPPPPDGPGAGPLWVDGPDGQLHGFADLRGAERPLVLVHGVGGSARMLDALARGLAGSRPVFAPDLPGHGESAGIEGGVGTWSGDVADRLMAALGTLGFEAVDIVAVDSGAAVALSLAHRLGRRLGRVALVAPPLPDAAERPALLERGMPDLSPRWDGGHVLSAWTMIRLSELFHPWFETNRAHALAGEPAIDPHTLHGRAVELLKAAPELPRAHADAHAFDLSAAVTALAVPVAVGTHRRGPPDGRVAALAATTSWGKSLILPPAQADWAAMLDVFLKA